MEQYELIIHCWWAYKPEKLLGTINYQQALLTISIVVTISRTYVPAIPLLGIYSNRNMYLYVRDLFSLIRIIHSSIISNYLKPGNNMNIQYQCKGPVTRHPILYDSILMKCPEQANTQRQKVDQCLLGAGENLGVGGHEEEWSCFEVMKIF